MDPPRLATLSGEITLDEALQEERNMLHRLTYWQKKFDFLLYLYEQKEEIESVVSSHLCLKRTLECRLTDPVDWIHGNFNLCLPVLIKSSGIEPLRRVIIRFPLPFKLGELEFPGNSDENLRCEAAA